MKLWPDIWYFRNMMDLVPQYCGRWFQHNRGWYHVFWPVSVLNRALPGIVDIWRPSVQWICIMTWHLILLHIFCLQKWQLIPKIYIMCLAWQFKGVRDEVITLTVRYANEGNTIKSRTNLSYRESDQQEHCSITAIFISLSLMRKRIQPKRKSRYDE